MHSSTRCGKFCCSFVPQTSKAGRDPPLDHGSLLHQALLQEDRLLPLHRLSPLGLIKPLSPGAARHRLLHPEASSTPIFVIPSLSSCGNYWELLQPVVQHNMCGPSWTIFFPLVPHIPVSIPEKEGCLGTQMTAPRILN